VRNAVLFLVAGLAAGFAALGLFSGGAPDAPLPELPPALHAAPRPAAAPALPVPVEPPANAHPAAEQEPVEADETPAAAAAATANRLDGLIAAGFSMERATQILRRETELRQAAYAAEYHATGTVRPFGSAARSGAAAGLRAELGDGEYERYLEGTGQPHSVVVRAVEAQSAAAHAGLLPGDEIRAYAGERVFNQRDLNALMQAGTPGEVVAATVVRDGQTLQLYVTRGPLGVL
jgi:hypothetical protein